MLQAVEALNRINRGQIARVQPLPIPLGGWSPRDEFLQTGRRGLLYSPDCDNMMWYDGKIWLRPGYSSWATGLPAAVNTLMEHSAPGGTRKLFAASDAGIYDVTSSGAVGAAAVGSLTETKFQHTMFATTSGHYLVCVSGADAIQLFNGSTWSTASITGVTAADIINVASFKGRLWLVEKDTLNPWYLPTWAIGGAAQKLTLAPLFTKGGYLMAIASISNDGGAGPDDYIAFITSEGQVAVYSGVDPNSVNTWGLVGIYDIDKPVGRRCWTKFGGDILIYTEVGVVKLTEVMAGIKSDDAVGSPVAGPFTANYLSASASFGWEIQPYTTRGWVIANVPSNIASKYSQFVYNQSMGAWFPFSDMNGRCWKQSGGDMYFGTDDGTIMVFDDGSYDDNGAAIEGYLGWAWYDFGTSNLKEFSLIRPHFLITSAIAPYVGVNTDYNSKKPDTIAALTEATGGALWNANLWNVTKWYGGQYPYSQWMTVEGEGIVGSPRIHVSTASAQVAITSIDVAFKDGGIL